MTMTSLWYFIVYANFTGIDQPVPVGILIKICILYFQFIKICTDYTDIPLYTDTRYNHQIRYNDNLTHETFT